MKWNKVNCFIFFLSFSSLFLFSHSIFADLILPVPYQTHSTKEVVFMGGGTLNSLTNNSNTTTLIQEQITAPRLGVSFPVDHVYQTTARTSVDYMAGIYFANIFRTSRDMQISVGPSFYFLNMGNVQGTDTLFISNTNEGSLNYKFHVLSYATFLESRISDRFSEWTPYLVGGVGVAWNDLYGYKEFNPMPVPPNTGVLHTQFRSHIQSAFSYEIGIGVQHLFYVDVKNQIRYRCGIEYRYFNTGFGRFSPSLYQANKDTMHISSIDTNTILFSLIVTG